MPPFLLLTNPTHLSLYALQAFYPGASETNGLIH